MTGEELVEALEARRLQRLERGRAPWPRKNPVASDIHPCERYMVLSILAWRLRPELSSWAMGQMEHGQLMEPYVLQQLHDEGWRVVRSQEPVEIRGRSGKVVLTGRIDGVLEDADGDRWILDAKDVALHTWNRIDTADDIRINRWTSKWIDQAQAYMLGLEIPRFLWVLSHRGGRKYVTDVLDYDRAEAILALCESSLEWARELEHLPLDQLDEALELPYLGRAEICRECPFWAKVCHPELELGGAVSAVVRDDLAEDVARLVELEEDAKEYQKIDRRLAKAVHGKHVLAGDYLLTGSWREVQHKAKPAQPARTLQQWVRQRLKLKGEG